MILSKIKTKNINIQLEVEWEKQLCCHFEVKLGHDVIDWFFYWTETQCLFVPRNDHEDLRSLL